MNEIELIGQRVDKGEKVTLEEAMAVVRSVQRTCKGPKKEGAEKEYAKMREVVGYAGGEDKGYALQFMDSILREGCGYNFNDIIVKYPFNGEDHSDLTAIGGPDKSVACPKCGLKISFRSPYFNLSD